VLVSEESKARVFFEFYDDLLGTPSARGCKLLLAILGLPRLELAGLGDQFTEQEMWYVISSLPQDKVPDPDGFTGRFL
jgi:hypothetical protein